MRWFLWVLVCCVALGLAGCGNKADFATGYTYTSDVKMKAVLVPKPLKGGQSKFELDAGGKTFPLEAGKRFFFKAEFPDGVDTFTIRGINESEQLDPKNMEAFPVGINFMQPGVPVDLKLKVIAKEPTGVSTRWVVGSVAAFSLSGVFLVGMLVWRRMSATS
jgi:hypothetical protein